MDTGGAPYTRSAHFYLLRDTVSGTTISNTTSSPGSVSSRLKSARTVTHPFARAYATACCRCLSSRRAPSLISTSTHVSPAWPRLWNAWHGIGRDQTAACAGTARSRTGHLPQYRRGGCGASPSGRPRCARPARWDARARRRRRTPGAAPPHSRSRPLRS